MSKDCLGLNVEDSTVQAESGFRGASLWAAESHQGWVRVAAPAAKPTAVPPQPLSWWELGKGTRGVLDSGPAAGDTVQLQVVRA